MNTIPYKYHIDGTHDSIAMFTITTIISDSVDHLYRGISYDTLCERLFRNTIGAVIVTNSMGKRIFYRHVPVPYYGDGTYDDALANYYETHVTFPYPTQCGMEVIITVRFTVDHDRLQAAEHVFKTFNHNGIIMTTEASTQPAFNFEELYNPHDTDVVGDWDIYCDDELIEESA